MKRTYRKGMKSTCRAHLGMDDETIARIESVGRRLVPEGYKLTHAAAMRMLVLRGLREYEQQFAREDADSEGR